MPIWIQENNSPREIGKLWVQESTSPAQIGKVWVQESDGPKLIWEDEYSIPMNTSNWTLVTEGGSDGSKSAAFSNGVLQLKSSGGSANGYWQANCAYAYTDLIDFSKYNKLTIKYDKIISAQYGTWSTAKAGILNTTDFVVYNNNGCTEQNDNNWTRVPADTTSTQVLPQSWATNGADRKATIEYDISDCDVTSRIFFVVYSYQSTGAQLFVSSVVLE